MAAVAGELGWKMVCRSGHIAFGKSVAVDMATGAISWGAFEDAVDVAGLASHSAVHAKKLKAGSNVIKLVRRRLGHGCHLCEQNQQAY